MRSATSTPTTRLPDAPERALGAFLRRMRDRARVEGVAGRRTLRRRAVGLRREEVAESAGISVTWYTWLEQGRPVRVSTATLRAIARALRLSAVERAHLVRLASAVAAPTRSARLTRRANDSVVAFVDALAPSPAYAVNGLWNVLHANRAASLVLGAFASTAETNNVLARLFLDPSWRGFFANEDAVREAAVAQFRAATGHMINDARWRSFIDKLSSASVDFDALWRRQDLASSASREKINEHRALGRLRFRYTSVSMDGEASDVRVIVYSASDAATAQVLLESLGYGAPA